MCIHFKLYLKDTDRYRYILSFVLSTGNKALSRSSKCSLRPWPPSYHWRTGDLQSRCHSKSMTLFFFFVCDNWSWTCYAKWNVFFYVCGRFGTSGPRQMFTPFLDTPIQWLQSNVKAPSHRWLQVCIHFIFLTPPFEQTSAAGAFFNEIPCIVLGYVHVSCALYPVFRKSWHHH